MSHHLLGPAEVADILSVSRQRVAQLAAASLDFPEPEVELAAGRIWSRESIEAWVAAHPERVKSQDPRTQCSFCLKQEKQVERIISGPGVYICNECVDEAGAAILAQGSDNALPKLSGLFHSELNLPEELGRQLERLDPLQRRVLTLRFGLDRGEPRTIGEVAAHLHLEVAEVRQIEATALSRLRPQP